MVEIRVYVGKEIEGIQNRVFSKGDNRINQMHYGSTLHPSEIESNLEELIGSAIEYELDVYLHTNSIDVIEWLPSVVSALGLYDNFTLIRIGRSAMTSNKGELIETCFDMCALEAMNAVGCEMR